MGENKILPIHLPNANAKSMEYLTFSSVILNATLDTNDMLG